MGHNHVNAIYVLSGRYERQTRLIRVAPVIITPFTEWHNQPNRIITIRGTAQRKQWAD